MTLHQTEIALDSRENRQEKLTLLAGLQGKSTNSGAKEIHLTFLLPAGC
jgi:hypothetical protein